VTRRSLLCLIRALRVRSAALRILRSTMRPLRLIVLLNYWVMRLVFVLLALQYGLLLRRRISITGVLPLVGRQRCAGGYRATIPMVPIASTLLPFVAPVVIPAWGRIGLPSMEVRWWSAVVAHRDA